MTKFPADKIGLEGRGEIKQNNFADLVIFDTDEINDQATFEDPEVLSAGVRKVFVNGKLSYENKKNITELNRLFCLGSNHGPISSSYCIPSTTIFSFFERKFFGKFLIYIYSKSRFKEFGHIIPSLKQKNPGNTSFVFSPNIEYS